MTRALARPRPAQHPLCPPESPSFYHVTAVFKHTAVQTARTLLTCTTVASVVVTCPLLPLRHKVRRRPFSDQFSRAVCTFFLLTMLMGQCLALPWVEESVDSVKLRTQSCQPVPEETLKGMLGPAYDPKRMADKDPITSTKRGDLLSEDQPDQETDDVRMSAIYQDDDPSGRGRYRDEDFVDVVSDADDSLSRQDNAEDRETEDEFEEELEEEGVKPDSSKTVLVSESPLSVSSDADRLSSKQMNPKGKGQGRTFQYMRRRRRTSDTELDSTESAGDSERGGESKKDSLLPLKLLLSGKNKKLRRKLKKYFRKKGTKLANKPPPWECKLKQVWMRLREGHFPRLLLDGKCLTDKCFYRLYDCVPQKYKVKILKRDPDFCNPLPTVGMNTTYEQKWNIVRYSVTVGCNCEQAPTDSSNSRRIT